MPGGESVNLRNSHFKRTGSKIYGIRNRTPSQGLQMSKGFANLNELSEKTRRMSLRVVREDSGDPVLDGVSNLIEVNSDSCTPNNRPKTMQLSKLQVPLSQWTYIGLMLWEPYFLNKTISVNQLEMIICRGL